MRPGQTRKLKSGRGLELLPVWLRIAGTIVAASLPLFVHSVGALLGFFVVGWLIVLAGPRRSWGLLLVGPILGSVVYFLFTVPFASVSSLEGSDSFLKISRLGVMSALCYALRVGSSQLFALGLLWSTSPDQVYAEFAKIKPVKIPIRDAARALQLMSYDLTSIFYAARMRGFRIGGVLRLFVLLRISDLLQSLGGALAICVAIVPRMMFRISLTAYTRLSAAAPRVAPCSSDCAVCLEELTVSYGGEPVLSTLSVQVAQGEFVCLVGTDMSGKSTLLRAIAGYIPCIVGCTEGRLDLYGEDSQNFCQREFASLASLTQTDFQQDFVGLTVGEELVIRAGSESSARHLGELFLGFESQDSPESLWERPVTHLSGGQQVRLRLAAAVAQSRPLLLFDRPSDHLDIEGRKEFFAILKRLRLDYRSTIVIADQAVELFRDDLTMVIELDGGRSTRVYNPSALYDACLLERWGMAGGQVTGLSKKPPEGKVIARLDSVTVKRDAVTALSDVSLCVAQSECVVVRGPNGSGKTTAMLVLAGALRATSGEVRVNVNVGYVAQDPLLQTLACDARGELELLLRLHGWSDIDHIREELAWLGLKGHEQCYALHQRDLKLLEISAVRYRIGLLILDEPSSGVDTTTIRKIKELVLRLRSQGTATMIVSHDEHFSDIADRTIWFSAGKIAASGVSASDLEWREGELKVYGASTPAP